MTDIKDNQFPVVSVGEIGGTQVQTVNARDLHAFLGVGTAFKDWIARRIADYGFQEDEEFCSFLSETPGGGRPAKEYYISLDMAKELSMVERNERGKEARQYFIRMEKRAHSSTPATIDVRDPTQLASIAIQLIEVNKELETRAITAEAAVEAAKPKTSFYDQFANSDGLFGLQNVGRILSEPPNKFIGWLKQTFLFYQGKALVPRAEYVRMGIFEVKSEIIEDKARYRTWVTPKGVQYLAKRLGKTIDLGGAA